MNKKKIAALALSGTLLAGAAGFGAYSWFTDSAKVSSNLTVSTGTLKLTASNDDAWTYTGPNGDQIVQMTKDGKILDPTQFSHAQPGDTFAKSVTLTNKGTLTEKVSFKVKDTVAQEYAGLVNVTMNEANGNPVPTDKPLTLKSGQTLVVNVTVGLDEKMKDIWQAQSIDLSKVLGGNLVEASALQVNAPADTPIEQANPTTPTTPTTNPTTPTTPAHVHAGK